MRYSWLEGSAWVLFALVKRTAGRNCSFRESRNFWVLSHEVVDVFGALLVDKGPRHLAYGVLQLVREPLDPAHRKDELGRVLYLELQEEVHARVHPAGRRGLPDGRVVGVLPGGVDDVADLLPRVEEQLASRPDDLLQLAEPGDNGHAAVGDRHHALAPPGKEGQQDQEQPKVGPEERQHHPAARKTDDA
jgi:hypothetical protein